MPLLLGYIIVGIIVSPVMGMLHEGRNIVEIGELGVMFMMFFIGMEFNPERLKKVMIPSVFGIFSQILVMGIFGVVCAKMLGLSSINGLFLGSMLAMSSTIVLVEILTLRGELSKNYAQIDVGILVLEDLFAIFLMVILSTIGGGSKPDFGELAQRCLVLSTFVVSVYIVGKLCVPWLIRKFALSKNPQVVIMFVFSLILGLGQLASVVNLSMALGAFLAGSILSGTAMSGRIESMTSSFRSLFVALFFVSVGTMIDPSRILEMWLPIVLISVAVIIVKTAACWLGVVFGGASSSTAYIAAINKAQIGEFSFVIATLGISMGVLDSSLLVIAMGVSFLTVFVNPFLSARAQETADFFGRIAPKKLKSGFDVYQRTLGVVLAAAHRNSYMKKLFIPSVKVAVYFLLFNGIMVATAVVCEYSSHLEFVINPKLYRAVVMGVGTLLSLPPVMGLLNAVGELVSAVVLGLPILATQKLSLMSRRLVAFMQTVFSTFTLILVATLYFFIFLAYIPHRDSAILLFLFAVAVAIIFGRFIININGALEHSFMRIFRSHLENADSRQREKMMENIKNNYSWLVDIAEVEVPELSEAAGKTIRDLAIRAKTGAEILAIKRGRFVVYDILPETRVFPDDIVIISGDANANRAAEGILNAQIKDFDTITQVEDVKVSHFVLREDSLLVGKTLSQTGISRVYSVRIVSFKHSADALARRPNPNDSFLVGDSILAMGLPENLEVFSSAYKLSVSEKS